jgi:hypothetical protein
MTVTGTRERYKCAFRQLQAHGLIFHQILQRLFARTGLRRSVRRQATFASFAIHLQAKCPHLVERLQNTMQPYVYLMGLDARHISKEIQTEAGCHRALWDFFGRLVCERPKIVQADTDDGYQVQFIHDSLKRFISEQVCFHPA